MTKVVLYGERADNLVYAVKQAAVGAGIAQVAKAGLQRGATAISSAASKAKAFLPTAGAAKPPVVPNISKPVAAAKPGVPNAGKPPGALGQAVNAAGYAADPIFVAKDLRALRV